MPVCDICQRVAAAVLGGYALTVAFSVCLSQVLPVSRMDGVMSGLLVSFLIYTIVVMWVFAARTLRRMWCGLTGAAFALLTALALLLRPAGVPW